MVTIPLDLGIVVASSGTIVTILLFVLKTYGTKTTNTVKQTEVVKQHGESLTAVKQDIEDIGKELDKLRYDIEQNKGRISNVADVIASITKTNDKVNTHDSDLVGLKRDIEYLKISDRTEQNKIDNLEKRMENIRDIIYNQRSASRWTQRDSDETRRQRKRDDGNYTDEG